MLTLLSLHAFNKQDKAKLIEGLGDLYTINFPDNFTEDNLVLLSRSAEVLIGVNISDKILDNCPNLKLIQTPCAGVDKIPFSILKKKRILLCNSHSNSYYVAEYAVTLLLTLTKKITLQTQGQFPETLKGKVIGVLGYGNVGKQVCEFLHPFGCNLMVLRRQKVEKINSKIEFTNDLGKVLSTADYIIVTLPLTSETEGLINEKEFALMKKSACLINVGRGQVINQKSLYLALRDKQIKAAAIDVWYDDFQKTADSVQFSKRYPFEKLGNIILSPHMAAIVGGAPHLDDVIANLRIFATKGKVINEVNLEQGY